MSSKKHRKLRNYLLDSHFQLKYTGMVVVVTVVVAAVLGTVAYDYSKGQTEALAVQIALQPDLNPAAAEDLEAFARSEDRKVLAAIFVGMGILVLALGLTGIVITHRVVGPVFRMRRLFRDVAEGKLRGAGTSLRSKDELQDLFGAYTEMVNAIRAREEQNFEDLAALLAKLREAGASESAVAELQVVVD